jgi:two-component system, sensor histidine kinase PdtaS
MIGRTFTKLSLLGIKAEYDFQLKKEVRLINIFNICTFLVGLYYTILLLAMQQPYLAAYDFPLVIFAAFAILLNHLGKHNSATYFTFLFLPVVLLAVSSVYGRVAGEYYLIPFIVILAYLNKPIKILVLFLIVCIITFIISKHFEATVVPEASVGFLAEYFYYTNIIFSFVLLFLFIRLFIRQYESNRKEINDKNNELSEINTKLANKNEKIQILIKEISHRTKNNLQLISSLISIQSEEIDSPENKAILDDIKARIFSIALVHKKLYLSKQTNQILLAEYVKELAETIINTFDSGADIDLKVESEEISVNIDDVVVLGIMLNELLSNAIEHGLVNTDNKEISLNISKISENKIKVLVYDSGEGISVLNNPNNHKFGFSLVLNLVEQLNGEIYIYEDSGNYIEMSLKLSDNEENIDTGR